MTPKDFDLFYAELKKLKQISQHAIDEYMDICNEGNRDSEEGRNAYKNYVKCQAEEENYDKTLYAFYCVCLDLFSVDGDWNNQL
jgi:hypothetical protein